MPSSTTVRPVVERTDAKVGTRTFDAKNATENREGMVA
jgi:hypothetical protein